MGEDTLVKSGRNETFVRKHKRWLSFLGALIVFDTFIYQEGVRDELKDPIFAMLIYTLLRLRYSNKPTSNAQKRTNDIAGASGMAMASSASAGSSA